MENLLTAEQAAKILGVAKSTFSRYKRSGLVPSIRIGRKERFPREAVERFRIDRDNGYTVKDIRGEIATLRYEVDRLNRLVDLLMLKMGLQDGHWHMSDSDLMSVYAMSEKVPGRVSLKHAKEWLEILLYFTESEFERLMALTGDPHPWRRFFSYTEELIQKLHNKKNYRANIELQAVTQNLVIAQQETRKCAILLLKTRPTRMSAEDRFDFLVTGRKTQELDPEEMLKNMKMPSVPSEQDQKKVTRLIEELTAYQGSPPEDTPEN